MCSNSFLGLQSSHSTTVFYFFYVVTLEKITVQAINAVGWIPVFTVASCGKHFNPSLKIIMQGQEPFLHTIQFSYGVHTAS
jgi:hypothetical protein